MSEDKADAESLLQFPCRFPIKVMGRDSPAFRDTVVAIITQHADQLPEDAVRTATSSKQAFVSVTVTIDAQSQSQLDRIYQELSDHEDVLVCL